ncbi:MAG: hypothetical protein ABI193_06580 [Minicystis sp.]
MTTVTALALAALLPLSAQAAPSIWAQAKDPALARSQALLREAESLELSYHQLTRLRSADRGPNGSAALFRVRERELLEQGGAARSPDPALRLRLAEVYHALHQDREAAALFEGLLRADLAPVIQADIYGDLAISYARLGRREEEIKAYTKALALEPFALARANLLANRAEAYMSIGDIVSAVEGYRASLSLLATPFEMLVRGTTTLWGLGVALDRAGDLDAGLEAIRVARLYDENDVNLNGPDWFYAPPHDEHWYKALGHWSRARRATMGAPRAEGYGRAVAAWQEYIESAPPGDRWVDQARARLRQCEKERDRAAPVPSPPAPAAPRKPR